MFEKIPKELTNEETIGVACAFRCVVAGYEKLGGINFGENVVIKYLEENGVKIPDKLK